MGCKMSRPGSDVAGEVKNPVSKEQSSLDDSFFGQEVEIEEEVAADGSRKYSVMSREAIETLDSLAEQIATMAARCDAVSAEVPTRAAGAIELKHFRSELAQLHGNVDKLQFNKIDAVMTGPLTSGKAAAKAQRKALTKQCIALGERIEAVVKQNEERLNGGAGAQLPKLELPALPVPQEVEAAAQ